MENEQTVEKKLKQAFKKMQNFDLEKGLPIVGWVFNSEFGSREFYQNSPIKIEKSVILSNEEKAKYHAERNCIKFLPKKFKQKGQNTIFVTLIPCPECLKFLWDEPENYHVIYFVDHLNKSKRPSYKEWNKKVPMIKYTSIDPEVNKIIDEIKKVYVEREEKMNGPIEVNKVLKK